MKAYKLFRIKKNGDITSLFINKTETLPLNTWLKCANYPTKGYAVRPFWHCMGSPIAPHLSTLSRKWFEINMRKYKRFERPRSQGTDWYLAKEIKIVRAIRKKNS